MKETVELKKTIYIVFFLDNYCDYCSVVRKHQVFWTREDAEAALDAYESEDDTNAFAYGQVVEVELDLGTVEFNLNDIAKIGSTFSTDFVKES